MVLEEVERIYADLNLLPEELEKQISIKKSLRERDFDKILIRRPTIIEHQTSKSPLQKNELESMELDKMSFPPDKIDINEIRDTPINKMGKEKMENLDLSLGMSNRCDVSDEIIAINKVESLSKEKTFLLSNKFTRGSSDNGTGYEKKQSRKEDSDFILGKHLLEPGFEKGRSNERSESIITRRLRFQSMVGHINIKTPEEDPSIDKTNGEKKASITTEDNPDSNIEKKTDETQGLKGSFGAAKGRAILKGNLGKFKQNAGNNEKPSKGVKLEGSLKELSNGKNHLDFYIYDMREIMLYKARLVKLSTFIENITEKNHFYQGKNQYYSLMNCLSEHNNEGVQGMLKKILDDLGADGKSKALEQRESKTKKYILKEALLKQTNSNALKVINNSLIINFLKIMC